MVDGSSSLVTNMVLLIHLGQLKTSYGLEQLQECRSLTVNGAQGVFNFSEFFFPLFGIESLRVTDKIFYLKYVG